jgi:hypothetical protein
MPNFYDTKFPFPSDGTQFFKITLVYYFFAKNQNIQVKLQKKGCLNKFADALLVPFKIP